jgi:CRP-like cAMP-binding protein
MSPKSHISGRLLAARFRPEKVRQILQEKASSKRKRRRPGGVQRPHFLTGTHHGLFYRIPVPPPQVSTKTPLPLFPLPKLFTPTSPPKPLAPVPSSTTTANIATTSAIPCSTALSPPHAEVSLSESIIASSSHASRSVSNAGVASTTASATTLAQHSAAQKRNEYWDQLWQWWLENYGTLILNFGSICTLIGFTRSDVLELRELSVTGSLCAMVYNFTNRPLRWTPILWSSTFAAVNGFKILQIVQERQGSVHFTREQEEQYIHFFMPHGVTPKQFEAIYAKATMLTVKKGTLLVRQGEALHHVYLVVAGSTRASVLGRFVTAASTTPTARSERAGGASGAWIGEVSLLEKVWISEQSRLSSSSNSNVSIASKTSNSSSVSSLSKSKSGKNVEGQEVADLKQNGSATVKANASEEQPFAQPPTPSLSAGRAMYTIVAEEDCTVLRWSHDDMQDLMARSTDMRAALTRAMTAAIVAKVINFTVSRSSAKTTWATWLDDWKYNAGAQVQTLAAIPTPIVASIEATESHEDEEEEELPRYPLKRFR